MQATYDDANLILRLYELRREETLRKARAWFAANFSASSAEEMMQKYPFGSQENTYVRMVAGYWEMACSFVTAGVLNRELLFESSGELLGVWEKLRHVMPGFRQVTKNPKAFHNLEVVGTAGIEYLKSRGPEAYEGFQSMMQAASAAAKS
jgi:hypothetical protein